MELRHAFSPAWIHYFDKDDGYQFHDDNCGSWKYTFEDTKGCLDFVSKLCDEAILNRIAGEAKHSNEDALRIHKKGSMFLFCNVDDLEMHKKIIAFFIKHDLLQKDDYGNFKNMAFQYVSQCKRKKGSIPIQLSDFIDLKTGEFHPNKY